MTIDILRSTNPALSLSSQVEDAIDGRHHLYGKPTPLQLMSPRDVATKDKRNQQQNTSRSKSAPPTEWNDEEPHEPSKSASIRQNPGSYSYDKWNEIGRDRLSNRTGGLAAQLSVVGGSSDGSSSVSTQEGDPEENDDDPLKRLFPGTVSLPVQKHHKEMSQQLEKNSRQTTAPTQLQQRNEDKPTSNNKAASPVAPAATATSLSSSRSSTSKSEGGVLVLRPNPVKTVPPISSQAVGVVAPAPRLASAAPFVAPSPVHSSAPSKDDEAEVALVTQHKSETTVTHQTSKADPWCKQASEKARKKEAAEKEKARISELKRRQALQCDFPNSYSNMPPASGRASAEDLNGAGEDRDNVSAARNHNRSSNNSRQQQHNPNAATRNSARSTTGSALPPLRSNRQSTSDEEEVGGARNIQSTPVFERLVTDEVRELQIYARMVENQDVELDKMRRYQKDLEKRLQEETRQHELLEATLEARERDWLVRFEELELEIKRLNGVVKGEENKNKLLLDQIRKKDQDIQGMLKKKYDHEASSTRRGFRGTQPEQRSDRLLHPKGVDPRLETHRSPDDYLKLLGSAEKVRERNARHLLMDFFGM